jgi:hypothetical protein
MKSKGIFKPVFIISILLLIINSCSKNTEQAAVPYVNVSFTIYLNNTLWNKLNTPGNWMYLTGGDKGIIIYRYDQETFSVWDRCCTYNALSGNAIVSVESNNVYAIDSSCGSVFNILNGQVQHSPATLPLKAYHYTFDPTANTLSVYN